MRASLAGTTSLRASLLVLLRLFGGGPRTGCYQKGRVPLLPFLAEYFFGLYLCGFGRHFETVQLLTFRLSIFDLGSPVLVSARPD